MGLYKIFIDFRSINAASEQPERAKFVASQFPSRSLGWLVNYGWPFVSKLGHDISVVFSH